LHLTQCTLQLSRVAKRATARHVGRMTRKSPLDDPHNAAHAWARYRQIMKVLLAATILTAVALGISLTMLLGGGLMGLVFLSNGTGHDESVDNQLPGKDEFWSPKDD
jgi:hypothetical protein